MMKKKSHLKSVAFCVVVVLCTALPVFAGITNGDFTTPDLYGWTVEYGTVTDGGGFAVFEEDAFDLSSTLSQVFTIPALALQLSFDVLMYSVEDGYESPSFPDTFTAALLDPATFDPFISWDPLVTDYYLLENTGAIETASGVTILGNTVSLDVTNWRGHGVFLSFDLWGGDDGMFTTVSLDNVEVSVVPAPGALLLGLIGSGMIGLWRRFSTRF